MNGELCRKLQIRFDVDGSVAYDFARRGRPLSRYVIEHPADQVDLLFADPGYEAGRTSDGYLRLTWAANTDRGWSRVVYRKRNKLEPCEPHDRSLVRYEEDIRISAEPHLHLWLGSPRGPLSAVRALCSADFGGEPMSLRRLSECTLRRPGILRVRWVLEPA